jgi:ElaB/YqjD/DUF883 family membrane-anchored ribosome-binding protein
METNYSSIPPNGSDPSTGAKNAYGEAKTGSSRSAPQRSAASLRAELASLKSDLDALVNRAPNLSDDELAQAHARLLQEFSSIRYAAKGFATEASRQLNKSVESTTEYVKEKPGQAIAAAAGVGLLLGLLFKRR